MSPSEKPLGYDPAGGRIGDALKTCAEPPSSSPSANTGRIACQCCRRLLVPLRDGTSRSHVPRRGGHFDDYCQGSRHRLARWPVGQRLLHHGGSVWEVERDLGTGWDDYLIRCVVGSRAFDGDRWLEAPGKTMVAHGEYLHRDGWREMAPAPRGEDDGDR